MSITSKKVKLTTTKKAVKPKDDEKLAKKAVVKDIEKNTKPVLRKSIKNDQKSSAGSKLTGSLQASTSRRPIQSFEDKKKKSVKASTKTNSVMSKPTNVTVNSPTHKKIELPHEDPTSDFEFSGNKHTRYNTRTLKVDEVKVLDVKTAPVETAIVGEPQAFFIPLESKVDEVQESAIKSSSESYEDDFDSYNSDFESYASSSVSSKADADSGNFEEVKAVDKSVEEVGYFNPVSQFSLTDEGFDENSTGVSSSLLSGKFAKKEVDQRADDLRRLIKLDEIHYSLFEMFPMSYDTFMAVYGKRDTTQTYSQTNEDKMDAELQTEPIISREMWCQHPIAFSGYHGAKEQTPLESYFNQKAGSGSDALIDLKDIEFIRSRTQKETLGPLSRFLTKVGSSVLEYLKASKESVGRRPIALDAPMREFIKNRSISKYFCFDNIFITIHPQTMAEDLIGAWILNKDVFELIRFAITSETVNCCTLKERILAAGVESGNVCVWDLREHEALHTSNYIPSLPDGVIVQKCSYHSCSMPTARSNSRGPVVDVAFLIDQNNSSKTTQIVTLHEFGLMNVWTIAKRSDDSLNTINVSIFDRNDAYWSRISLIKNKTVDLNDFTGCKVKCPSVALQNEKRSMGRVQERIGIFRAFSEDDFAEDDPFVEEILYSRLDDVNSQQIDLEHEVVICRRIKHFVCDESVLIVGNGRNIYNVPLGSSKPKATLSSCCDEGSYVVSVETCPVNLPFYLATCNDNTIHLYSSKSSRPIKNFNCFENFRLYKNKEFNDSELKKCFTSVLSMEDTLLSVLPFNSNHKNVWYGKTRTYWTNENPYVFLSVSNYGIVWWDLKYSDIRPRLLLKHSDTTKGKISNVERLHDLLVLHTFHGIMAHQIEEIYPNSTYHDTNQETQLLKTYLQLL